MYYGERFNSITHTVGAALAAMGGTLLIIQAARSGDAWKIVSCSIYAATLLALYLTSTLYHSLRGRAKDVLRQMDYCAIYLLIAGSYTPFTLVSLRGRGAGPLFGVVWGPLPLASCRNCCSKAPRAVAADLRGDGLGGRIGASPLIDALGWNGFMWLAIGGLVYTVGIFFVTDHKWRYGHGVAFVCTGRQRMPFRRGAAVRGVRMEHRGYQLGRFKDLHHRHR
jgi:hemolysin III